MTVAVHVRRDDLTFARSHAAMYHVVRSARHVILAYIFSVGIIKTGQVRYCRFRRFTVAFIINITASATADFVISFVHVSVFSQFPPTV